MNKRDTIWLCVLIIYIISIWFYNPFPKGILLALMMQFYFLLMVSITLIVFYDIQTRYIGSEE